MDTDTRTTPDHSIGPGGDSSQRESSWADVDAALEQARQRLRPRWWAPLPEAVLLLIGLTAILTAADWGWLILVCLAVLLAFGRIQPALVGVEHRYPAHGPASAMFLATKTLVMLWIVGVIWTAPEGRPLSAAVALGLVTVVVFGVLELLTKRMLATSMPGAGQRWASLARRPELHPTLRDPVALRAMVILHPTRGMRITQLADDLGMERAHAQTLLESLEGRGLVTLRKKIIDGPDRLWTSSVGRGQTVLEAHLAAMARTAGGAA